MDLDNAHQNDRNVCSHRELSTYINISPLAIPRRRADSNRKEKERILVLRRKIKNRKGARKKRERRDRVKGKRTRSYYYMLIDVGAGGHA